MHKRGDLHRHRSPLPVLKMPIKKLFNHIFNYICYKFRPAKKLTPEGERKIKEVTAGDNDPNNFSPAFTNTKDAIDWLNS